MSWSSSLGVLGVSLGASRFSTRTSPGLNVSAEHGDARHDVVRRIIDGDGVDGACAHHPAVVLVDGYIDQKVQHSTRTLLILAPPPTPHPYLPNPLIPASASFYPTFIPLELLEAFFSLSKSQTSLRPS